MKNYKAYIPQKIEFEGLYTKLQPLNAKIHGKELHEEAGMFEDIWQYLLSGPFNTKDDFMNWLTLREVDANRTYYTILNTNNKALGSFAIMDVNLEHGRAEIGGIFFGKNLQKTRKAKESIFLLLKYCSENLNFRRIDWRCNSLNEPSKNAGLRFGFKHEGKSRDTLLAMTSEEWSEIKKAFEKWLSPTNFNEDGSQKTKLSTKV
jgi:RimJ/RimL family protein N-acetyltransferase